MKSIYQLTDHLAAAFINYFIGTMNLILAKKLNTYELKYCTLKKN